MWFYYERPFILGEAAGAISAPWFVIRCGFILEDPLHPWAFFGMFEFLTFFWSGGKGRLAAIHFTVFHFTVIHFTQ